MSVDDDDLIRFRPGDQGNAQSGGTFRIHKSRLNELGLQFVTELACGVNGCTLLARHIETGIDVVVKVNCSELEYLIAKWAGEHGIGPEVYAKLDVQGYQAFAMETMEITAGALASDQPSLCLPEQLQFDLFDLAHRCIQAGFLHHDIHPGNIMRKGPRFYLIDYGGAAISASRGHALTSTSYRQYAVGEWADAMFRPWIWKGRLHIQLCFHQALFTNRIRRVHGPVADSSSIPRAVVAWEPLRPPPREPSVEPASMMALDINE